MEECCYEGCVKEELLEYCRLYWRQVTKKSLWKLLSFERKRNLQRAFCTNWPQGKNFALLDGKKSVASSIGTSKTKESQAWQVVIPLCSNLLRSFTIQYGWFCTMWPVNAKGPLGENYHTLIEIVVEKQTNKQTNTITIRRKTNVTIQKHITFICSSYWY